MTVTVITTNTTVGISMPANGDSLIVSPTGSIIAPAQAINGPNAVNQHLSSAGFLDVQFIWLGGGDILNFAASSVFNGHSTTCIFVGANSAQTTFVGQSTLTNHGSISADNNAIELFGGGNSLTNTGSISAVRAGITVGEHGGSNQITNSGSIASSAGIGVEILGTNDNLINIGAVSSGFVGIDVSSVAVGVNLFNSGFITGQDIALRISGGSCRLVNDGTIQSTGADAIVLNGNGCKIDNGGRIESTSTAIVFNTAGSGTVENHGVIVSAIGTGVDFGASAALRNDFINLGTVEGLNLSFQGGGGQDVVTNSGTMVGSVDLGAGNDIFDGRGGTVTGSVTGGAGADTYTVDDATIQLQELATVGEIDSVFAAVSFRLAANIENLTLLEAGDINGVGNAAANFMTGNSGENRLLGLDGNDTITGDVGNDKVWGCNGDDAVNGGAGDDTVLGNSGNDVVQGGDGDDLLIGGLGRDTIIGGNGADVFLFTSLAQSGATPALADAITDFTNGEDIIDLSKIDAKSNNAVANDAFIFIGSAAFSNVAGQMHAIQIAGNTFIEMDVNGDSVADCVIQLNGLLTMNAGDFVL